MCETEAEELKDAEEELRLATRYAGWLREELGGVEQDVAVCRKRVERAREKAGKIRGGAEKGGEGG